MAVMAPVLRRAWVLAALLPWAGGAPAGLEVTDDLGKPVLLAQPARRVVSLAPHLTELVYALGAGDRLVGVVAGSDWPPGARRLPRVGGHGGLDLETILALRPDLVLAWGSGNPPAQVEKLRALGLTVFHSEPRRPADVAATLERLGRLLGRADDGRSRAGAFRDRLASLRRRYAERRPVAVFYQVWHRPLVTLNGEHLVSRLLRICGGRNIFAELPELAPQVSLEAVLVRDPEVILTGDAGGALAHWRRWPDSRAVARGHLAVIPADLLQRPGPRLLEGATRLCEVLERARGGTPTRLDAARGEPQP